MKRTAFAPMSKSKFRAVTTTVFQLEPGNVIRAKDRQAMARQMSKRMGAQGQASTSDVDTETAEISSKHPETTQEAGQAPIYKKAPLEEDSSQLAKIARLASATNADEAATKHAIPGIRQIPSESISGSTTDIKRTDNQAVVPSAPFSVSENDPSHKPRAATDTHVNPPQSCPNRNPSSRVQQNGIAQPKATRHNPRKSHPPARASLEQSRPRRSARKASTSHPTAEVDWSEDIRPTDDEKSPNEKGGADKRGASRGTPVSSPDAGSVKSSRKKRKAPKVKPDSAKRQKATKKKGSISARLPLTAKIGDKCQSETDKADALLALELPDRRLDNACTQDGLDIPAPSFPVIDNRDDELEAVSPRHEITELSSDSLLQSNLSSPRQATGLPRSNGPTAKANSHGRGVTVGQKLTDALREAGLNSQYPPGVELRFPPSQITVGGTVPEIPRSNFTLPTQVPQAQSPFSSELGMVQDGPSATFTAGEQKNPKESDEISITSTHTQQTTGISLTTVVPPARDLSDMQKVLHITGFLDRKGDGDDASNPMVIPDDSSVAHLSEVEMDPMQLPHTGQDIAQASLQHLEDELETSSLSSEIPLRDGIMMLPVRGSESEHTPESQKPLLSVHTRLQQIAPLIVPKSITWSSIVDRNGSPRLRPQTDMKTERSCLNTDRFFLQSIKLADSSSSEYDGDSDGYYPESKYQSGGGWSKFQRDMFMEYGIGPEELTAEVTGPALFGDAVKVAARVDQINKVASEDDTELLQENKPGNHNFVGSGVARNDRASAVAPSSILRSIDDPRMEASHDAHNFEKRLSTFMQGDLNNMNWITDLQAAQQSAHSLLLETNQNLSSQLAAEQNTIRQVLQIYRQGCNRILDDLLRAQEVRVQLYQQQMSSVKEQHTQFCQELIQGLQELDHRVQQGP